MTTTPTPSTCAKRYGPEIKPEQLFDRRRPGGRILTLDGYPHRGQPIMLTEFGGVAFSPMATAERQQTWGYTTRSTAKRVHRAVQRLLHTVIHTALFSGFCYTQFTDTFQEANGLLYRRPHAEDPAGADRRGNVSASRDAHCARSRVACIVCELVKPDGRA